MAKVSVLLLVAIGTLVSNVKCQLLGLQIHQKSAASNRPLWQHLIVDNVYRGREARQQDETDLNADISEYGRSRGKEPRGENSRDGECRASFSLTKFSLVPADEEHNR